MPIKTALIFLALSLCAHMIKAYSTAEDAHIIRDFKRDRSNPNHPNIARQLVHQANWSPMGTISNESSILGFPMVSTMSIDDNDSSRVSTGKIRFLLTDLDFPGKDWYAQNKVTFLFSDEQNLNCRARGIDPMESRCERAIISGKVNKLNLGDASYIDGVNNFIHRHPAAGHWMKTNKFYLCELDIENIFVLDQDGGAHKVSVEEYYNEKL